jgi:hypothetical protein
MGGEVAGCRFHGVPKYRRLSYEPPDPRLRPGCQLNGFLQAFSGADATKRVPPIPFGVA